MTLTEKKLVHVLGHATNLVSVKLYSDLGYLSNERWDGSHVLLCPLGPHLATSYNAENFLPFKLRLFKCI